MWIAFARERVKPHFFDSCDIVDNVHDHTFRLQVIRFSSLLGSRTHAGRVHFAQCLGRGDRPVSHTPPLVLSLNRLKLVRHNSRAPCAQRCIVSQRTCRVSSLLPKSVLLRSGPSGQTILSDIITNDCYIPAFRKIGSFGRR